MLADALLVMPESIPAIVLLFALYAQVVHTQLAVPVFVLLVLPVHSVLVLLGRARVVLLDIYLQLVVPFAQPV